MDDLDRNLLDLFTADPRVGVLEASRRLGVARGTVQARLDRLAERGVVTGWGPSLDPAAMGHPVTAFLTLEIRQQATGGPGGPGPGAGGSGAGGARGAHGAHDEIGTALARVPEVLEACTITGPGDLWVRVVARSNADLQRVIDAVLAIPGVERSSTVIALATQVPYRVSTSLGTPA